MLLQLFLLKSMKWQLMGELFIQFCQGCKIIIQIISTCFDLISVFVLAHVGTAGQRMISFAFYLVSAAAVDALFVHCS